MLLAACKLDSAPIKPGQAAVPVPGLDGGNAGMGAAGAAGTSAFVGGAGGAGASGAGSGGIGTGGTSGSFVDAGTMDARTTDTGAGDASMDASTDARPPGRDAKSDGSDASNDKDAMPDPKEDANVEPDSGPEPEPDSGVDAGKDSGSTCDEEPPCHCPHEAPDDKDGCEAAACDFEDCSPDNDCEYVSSSTGKYYVCDTQRMWQVARQRCESQTDMRLASVESEEEDEFLFSLIDDKTWVGGNDLGEEGTWVWSDGTHFFTDAFMGGGPVDDAYNNWNAAEPNNLGLGGAAAHCMILWIEGGTIEDWADADCTDPHGFICEVID